DGPFAGHPRVYVLGLELTAHSDSSLDEAIITRFVQAFQTATPLTIGELWAIPIMLRLSLVENLRRLAEQIVQFRAHRQLAQTWIGAHLPALKNCTEVDAFALQAVTEHWRDCYVCHLLEGLHDHEVIHPDGVE